MSTKSKYKGAILLDRFVFGAKMHEDEDRAYRPTALPAVMVPAMSYMPMQFYDTIFEVEEGFHCGTVFPELVKPFTGCDPR